MNQFGQLNINAYKPPHLYDVQRVRLHTHEELLSELILIPAGASLCDQREGNANRLFDVIEGRGSFVVGESKVSGEAGKCVFVPAGVAHSLTNLGDEPWVVRLTAQNRIYPRHIGMLVGRAIRNRLGL